MNTNFWANKCSGRYGSYATAWSKNWTPFLRGLVGPEHWSGGHRTAGPVPTALLC